MKEGWAREGRRPSPILPTSNAGGSESPPADLGSDRPTAMELRPVPRSDTKVVLFHPGYEAESYKRLPTVNAIHPYSGTSTKMTIPNPLSNLPTSLSSGSPQLLEGLTEIAVGLQIERYLVVAAYTACYPPRPLFDNYKLIALIRTRRGCGMVCCPFQTIASSSTRGDFLL